MRILMVGEIDAAGREIAARLYKENHKISWLAGPGQEGDETKAAGKVYRKEITYGTCMQIMGADGIDTLFFLPPDVREPEETEKHWTPAFLNSQMEVLSAAAAAEIKRVVYLSSAMLNHEDVLTEELEALRAGERICLSYGKTNKAVCLIVRTSFLVAKGSETELGYLGYMLGRMRKGKSIHTRLTADSTLDYVFGSDLADGVLRLMSHNRDGIYTVATGQPVRLDEFFGILAEVSGYEETIEYGREQYADIAVEEDKLRMQEGWMPFYTFRQDGKAFLNQITESDDKAKNNGAGEMSRRQQTKRFLLECAQNLLLFVVACFLQEFVKEWSDFRFVDVRLAYVVIISISFGMRQGLIASGLACLAYLYSMSQSGVDLSFVLYSIESWIPFIVYGVSGAIAGYAADKRVDELEETRDEMKELDDKYQFLKMIYREVLEVKNQLQKQVMVSKDSFLHVYEISEKLDSLSPKAVLFKTLQVMEEIMECHSVVIYLKTDTAGRYGRTIACSEEISGKITPSIDFGSFPQMQEVLAEGKLFVNRELLKGYPSYAMPVIKDGQVVVVVCLYEVKFDKFTVYYKNMFQTVVQMVQNNLIRAYEHQDAEGEKRYLEGTGFLSPQAYEAELQILREAEEETHTRFMTGIINVPEHMGIKELSEKASGLIRGIDIIGKDSRGHFSMILMNTDETGRQVVEKRFLNHGLSITWEE